MFVLKTSGSLQNESFGGAPVDHAWLHAQGASATSPCTPPYGGLAQVITVPWKLVPNNPSILKGKSAIYIKGVYHLDPYPYFSSVQQAAWSILIHVNQTLKLNCSNLEPCLSWPALKRNLKPRITRCQSSKCDWDDPNSPKNSLNDPKEQDLYLLLPQPATSPPSLNGRPAFRSKPRRPRCWAISVTLVVSSLEVYSSGSSLPDTWTNWANKKKSEASWCCLL